MQLTRGIVNNSIKQAMAVMDDFGIRLPKFAFWTVDDWATKGHEFDEIRECRLGWDVTDFGSLDFENIGRTLFTLRNGNLHTAGYPKSYAHKFLLNPEGQRAPAHFHKSKMEDIQNLAGGNVLVQLTATNPDNSPNDDPLTIKVDGEAIPLQSGGIIRLEPGMSICIPPRTIHQFWAEEGKGITVSAEVSSVCDDLDDNYFLDPAQRFPEIVEDEAQEYYLCSEYPAAIG